MLNDWCVLDGGVHTWQLKITWLTSDSTAEQVAWAGLPINLDFAFSQAQRDKVYAQYLMRNRGRS